MVKWRSDFDKFVIGANFERRGWAAVEGSEAKDWDIYWAAVGTVREIFLAENGVRLMPGQLLNHFPNHYELTRKARCGGGRRRSRLGRAGRPPSLADARVAHCHRPSNPPIPTPPAPTP